MKSFLAICIWGLSLTVPFLSVNNSVFIPNEKREISFDNNLIYVYADTTENNRGKISFYTIIGTQFGRQILKITQIRGTSLINEKVFEIKPNDEVKHNWVLSDGKSASLIPLYTIKYKKNGYHFSKLSNRTFNGIISKNGQKIVIKLFGKRMKYVTAFLIDYREVALDISLKPENVNKYPYLLYASNSCYINDISHYMILIGKNTIRTTNIANGLCSEYLSIIERNADTSFIKDLYYIRYTEKHKEETIVRDSSCIFITNGDGIEVCIYKENDQKPILDGQQMIKTKPPYIEIKDTSLVYVMPVIGEFSYNPDRYEVYLIDYSKNYRIKHKY